MGLVAGFLETGESLEACVHREVFEDRRDWQIRNLRYFGNQPWPYPSSLMVGFIADYAAGEIPPAKGRVQRSRRSSTAARLPPPSPPPLSLARRMIDWWLDCPSSR